VVTGELGHWKSDVPQNQAVGSPLKFFALRDIAPGEEVFMDMESDGRGRRGPSTLQIGVLFHRRFFFCFY
jgi:hypothetical protein